MTPTDRAAPLCPRPTFEPWWGQRSPEPMTLGSFGELSRMSSVWRASRIGTVTEVSTGFRLALGVALAALLVVRLHLASLPLRGRATTLSFSELGLVGVGLAVLTFHCAAMFFRSLAERVPGAGNVISDIRALGIVSLLWYAVPSLLVLVGLRRLPRVALLVPVVALLFIGVTMYDGGSLDQHLFALFVGVVALAATFATLVRPPSRSTRFTV